MIEVQIARINGTEYPSHDTEDDILKRFFSSARNVSEGQILTVGVSPSQIILEKTRYIYVVVGLFQNNGRCFTLDTEPATTKVVLQRPVSVAARCDDCNVERALKSPNVFLSIINSVLLCANNNLKLSLMKCHTLVEVAELELMQDAVKKLIDACVASGIGFVVLDARMLFMKQSLSVHKLQSIPQRITLLSDCNIETIMKCTPCVVLVDNLDMVYEDPSTMAGHVNEENLEEMFTTRFKTFSDELFSAIHEKYQTMSLNGDVVTKEDFTVMVVAVTSNGKRMKSSLKSQFSRIIPFNEKMIEVEVNYTVDKTLADWNSSDEANRIKEKAKLINIIHSSCRDSKDISKNVINDLKLCYFISKNQNIWYRNNGMSVLINSDNVVVSIDSVLDNMNSFTYVNNKNSVSSLHKNKDFKRRSNNNNNIAAVYWKDIGGLKRVRKEILEVLELPYLYPHLFPPGCPRRQGVLLYGPPGTGKTLVAKAVATECKMTFLSIKGPELLDSFVGESEKNIREIFSNAIELSPCILFFDEIDSLAPARAKGNDSGGGVMDRIVSQLLTEMDQLALLSHQHHQQQDEQEMLVQCGSNNNFMANKCSEMDKLLDEIMENASEMQRILYQQRKKDALAYVQYQQQYTDNTRVNNENVNANGTATPLSFNKSTIKSKFVFVIGATNRPDLLDPALLRPGRFDRKIYLGVCKEISERLSILQAQTRKFSFATDVDLNKIAELLPNNVTGADIGSLTSTAFQYAMKRKIDEITLLAQQQQLQQKTNEAHNNHDDHNNMLHVKSYMNTLSVDELNVTVTQDDLLLSCRNLKPTLFDHQYYESIESLYDNTTSVAASATI